MRAEVTPTQVFAIDDKRLHVAATLRVECPKCTKKRVYNFADRDYLSYVPANKPFPFTAYCVNCGHEWAISLLLTVRLEVADGDRA